MNQYIQKSALITGASRGMGRAIAVGLASQGYDLALCARNMDVLAAFKEELLTDFPSVTVHVKAVDFTKEGQVEELANWAVDKFPALDVLVNNVGIYERVSLLGEQEGVFERGISVNLSTPHYLSVFFGKRMQNAKKGHIFSITSIASREPVKEAGSYTVSKFALSGLTKVLREELRPYQVKVTELIPSSTLTSSWDGTTIPPERFILPEDIAKVVLACLSLSTGANIEEVLIKPVMPI